MNFQTATTAFKNDKINDLAQDEDGLRFLKLRSLSRKDYMVELANEAHINITTTPARDLLKKLFESPLDCLHIEDFVKRKFSQERMLRVQSENQLITELYRLEVFDWGGLHQNSLEKTIVDNYVKKIKGYDNLCECIDNELHTSLKGYVLCSWYNHWTSIIIEDIFKEHPTVLPAIGLVKKIDFFINNLPFDLKVTYLPEGYISGARQSEGLRPELTLLKQSARALHIHYDNTIPAGKLLDDLWQKLDDHPSPGAKDLINELENFRVSLIDRAIQNPTELLVWLYENQGARRFDSSNRLFLVIIDKAGYRNSWKLKRAKPLLVDKVHSFLDQNDAVIGRDVQFHWEGATYRATSDLIFVIKE